MRIVASEWMSLDGVVQAPGEPDEDTSGGFAHGGWHLPYFDDASRQWVVEGLDRADGFLFGRRTYEGFAGHWPTVGEDQQVVARPLNTKPKYVASRTLSGPLAWQNSTLLDGDAVAAVARLRERGHGELHLIGSADLARTLLARGLVDELRLMVDPLTLGGGKGLFPDDGAAQPWRLLDSVATSTGALLLRYAAG